MNCANTNLITMKLPLISTIFVNYNGREHLEYCLPSLLKTNYPKEKLEVIVVDNSSQDDSVEFIQQKYPQIKIVVSTNEGYGTGINKGFQVSRGDYLAILNLDIKFHPDWLIHLLTPFRQEKNVGITGPLLLEFDFKRIPQEIKIPCFSKFGYPYSHTIPHLAGGQAHPTGPIETIWVPGAAMLIKRKLFKKINGFDPIYFLYYEDFDFCFRARMAGYKILLAPKSAIYHKESALIDPVYTPTEKVFLTAQNSIITILKNYSLSSLILYLPLFCLLRTADIINDILHPTHRTFARAKVKACWSAFRKIGTIITKRRSVQKIRVTPDKEIFKFNYGESLLKTIRQKIF